MFIFYHITQYLRYPLLDYNKMLLKASQKNDILLHIQTIL